MELKNILSFCIPLVVLIFLSSCEVDNIKPYHGKPSIYIDTSVDSGLVSFAFAPKKKDSLVKIPVKIMGRIVNQDRSYKLKIMDKSTAIKGKNYTLLNKDFSIKAGSYTDTIKVRLKNTGGLKDHSIFAGLKLEKNKNFKTKYKNDGAATVTQYRLYTNNKIFKPSCWISFYFGRFTRAKYFVMQQVTGLVFKGNMCTIYYNDKMTFVAYKVQRYLDDQAAKGNVIHNDDGTVMKMGDYIINS